MYEGVQNKAHYLDDGHLSVGSRNAYGRATLPEIYAQYSEVFALDPGQVLTPGIVEGIYEQELFKTCRNGTYCGIWQPFQAATALGRPIMSVYPESDSNICKDLNSPHLYPNAVLYIFVLHQFSQCSVGLICRPKHRKLPYWIVKLVSGSLWFIIVRILSAMHTQTRPSSCRNTHSWLALHG